MKLLATISLLFSMSAFAQEKTGYVCLPNTPEDATQLDKLKQKLGSDYLPEIGVLLVRPETCAETHVMIYQDVCQAGPFTVNLGLDYSNSELVVGRKIISLSCEEDRTVGPLN